MDIRRYWAKVQKQTEDCQGKSYFFEIWGSSNESLEQAKTQAEERLSQIVAKLLNGLRLDRYAYGDRPVREEILEELPLSDGGPRVILTRNVYGCEVLNADKLMFIDIDEPKVSGLSWFSRVLTTFFKKPQPIVPSPQPEILQRIESIARDNPSWGIRVYKTAAGYRCLMTHALYDPGSFQALAVLRLFGSDPLYVKLCQLQKSFRARLTPKPWRCGFWANRLRYPIESAKLQRQFEKWKEQYATRSKGFATCTFVQNFGAADIDPGIEAVIELHDRSTRANSSLPLA